MDTIEFYFEIHDTTPVRISGATTPPTKEQSKGLSYWALSFDAYGPYPPVLAHVYCPGPLPSDERRDTLNAVVKARVGELLTGERDSQHIDELDRP